jgi:hypothetical protein
MPCDAPVTTTAFCDVLMLCSGNFSLGFNAKRVDSEHQTKRRHVDSGFAST